MHVVRLLCIISDSVNMFLLRSENKFVKWISQQEAGRKLFILFEHNFPMRDQHVNSPFDVKA